MQGPQAHRWHVETCEMAANSAKELFQVFQQLSGSHKLPISLASLICEGCCLLGKWTIWKSKPVLYTTQWAERVGICSGETVVWPPRSIVLAQKWSQKQSKFKKFSWGACPQTTLAVVCLRTHYEPDHFKPDDYSPVLFWGSQRSSPKRLSWLCITSRPVL